MTFDNIAIYTQCKHIINSCYSDSIKASYVYEPHIKNNKITVHP